MTRADGNERCVNLVGQNADPEGLRQFGYCRELLRRVDRTGGVVRTAQQEHLGRDAVDRTAERGAHRLDVDTRIGAEGHLDRVPAQLPDDALVRVPG